MPSDTIDAGDNEMSPQQPQPQQQQGSESQVQSAEGAIEGDVSMAGNDEGVCFVARAVDGNIDNGAAENEVAEANLAAANEGAAAVAGEAENLFYGFEEVLPANNEGEEERPDGDATSDAGSDAAAADGAAAPAVEAEGPFYGFEEDEPTFDNKDMSQVLQIWETKHTHPGFDPVPALKR